MKYLYGSLYLVFNILGAIGFPFWNDYNKENYVSSFMLQLCLIVTAVVLGLLSFLFLIECIKSNAKNLLLLSIVPLCLLSFSAFLIFIPHAPSIVYRIASFGGESIAFASISAVSLGVYLIAYVNFNSYRNIFNASINNGKTSKK